MVSERNNAYEDLCGTVRGLGGTIRLAREATGWALVATVPGEGGALNIAGGFVFAELAELESLARLLLRWLDAVADNANAERRHP